MKGYGIYWALIEMLREETSHKLELKYIDEIAFSLVVDDQDLKSVINDFELFVIDDDYFYLFLQKQQPLEVYSLLLLSFLRPIGLQPLCATSCDKKNGALDL